MKLTPDSLGPHLERQLAPAYLVSGDEPLLTAEAADAIRAKARAAGFTEREVHFIDKVADWADVRAAGGTLSLFGARRVVEIRLPTGKAGTAGNATLVDMLVRGDADTVYLILTPRLERDAQSADWVRAVESRGGWVQVWPIDAAGLVTWLKSRSRRLKLVATDDALQLLAARTEGNLLAAAQELEKLSLLATDGCITADTVLDSVADSARFDVFQLSEAVLLGDAARALHILAGLRAEGVEATLVLWSLTKALRDIWGAVAAPSGSKGRIWHRQAAALDRAVRRAPRMAFSSLTLRATRADRMAKGRLTGDAWDEMALLAADICGRPAVPAPRSVLK